MKVLFFNDPPFFLTHGGMQTWTEALMREVAALGVAVEPVRWWDDKQTGDVIHHFSRPPIATVRAAHGKGIKMVMTECLDVTASRSRFQLFSQRCLTRFAQQVLPDGFTNRLGWDVYHELDAMVYVVQHEWEAAQYLFGADPGRGHIIPHGLEPEAMEQLARPQTQGDYLVFMATIYERKNPLLLAQAARLAEVPVVFLGKAFDDSDPYVRDFKKLMDGRLLRHAGHVTGEEKNSWLRGARGFVLLSRGESGCIAIYEAGAAGLPLLLSDLSWANRVYPSAQFVGLESPAVVAPVLKKFYESARRQSKPTIPLLTWRQVAERYLEVYQTVLRGP